MENTNLNLQPGERVVATAKLHLGAVIVPALLLLVGAVVLFVNISPTIDQFRVLAILVVVAGLWATINAVIARLGTSLVMTDERLLAESGMRPHKKTAVFIRNLDSVIAKRSLLGSLLGYGTLVVNARGQGNLRLEFPQIIGADKIAEQIRALMSGPAKAGH
jgi:uncharacterized membrane protein YdbT with pleckstrin-like domain